ncbi:MAG: CinA family protein [Opitutaceae bacterium]
MSATAVDLKALMLRAPRLTLAVAESMTCGNVQSAVGAVSGASKFFLGGITTYTLDEKVRHLGVERAAKKVNGVAVDIAEQMARGVCRLFGSDLGVATTGYAEPSNDAGIAEPFAWWAIAHRQGKRFTLRSGRIECIDAKRVEAQTIVAQAALAELVEYLRELRGSVGRTVPVSRSTGRGSAGRLALPN